MNGYERPFDNIWGPISKNGFSARFSGQRKNGCFSVISFFLGPPPLVPIVFFGAPDITIKFSPSWTKIKGTSGSRKRALPSGQTRYGGAPWRPGPHVLLNPREETCSCLLENQSTHEEESVTRMTLYKHLKLSTHQEVCCCLGWLSATDLQEPARPYIGLNQRLLSLSSLCCKDRYLKICQTWLIGWWGCEQLWCTEIIESLHCTKNSK